MEEKKKKTTTTKSKQTTRSKNNPNKKNTTKRSSTKPVAKKTPVKKASNTTKKNTTRKTPAAKKVVKEVNKKSVEPIEIEKETKLEKTIVFNGLEEKNVKEVVENLEQERIITDDKIIEKSSKNKNIIIVIAILIVLTIGISTRYVLQEIANGKKSQESSNNILDKIQNKKTNTETQTSSKTNEIEEATYSTIKTITLREFEEKVLAKEDMNVIVSSSTCYYCLAFEPIVHEVLTDLNKTIYRINIFAMSDEDVKVFREYYPYSTTPTIFTIKDGYVKSELVGSRSKDKFMEWAKDNLN